VCLFFSFFWDFEWRTSIFFVIPLFLYKLDRKQTLPKKLSQYLSVFFCIIPFPNLQESALYMYCRVFECILCIMFEHLFEMSIFWLKCSWVLGFMYNLHFKCLIKCLNEFFINCLIFYGVGRFETMTDLFSVSIHFNGGNPQMLKVRYINVTLKDLKINRMKSTRDSTPETQGGWNTFGMNVQRWTTGE